MEASVNLRAAWFQVRLPAAALGDNGAAAAVLVSSARAQLPLTRCERRGFIVRLPAAALGDNGAAAGTDEEAFCVNLCERRGFLLRLPEHA